MGGGKRACGTAWQKRKNRKALKQKVRGTGRTPFPRSLKMRGIADMEHANRKPYRYVAIFNERFANKPRVPESLFVPH